MQDSTTTTSSLDVMYFGPETTRTYYWIRYSLPSGKITTTCIKQHPFHFIHNLNYDPACTIMEECTLIDWKVITRMDYDVWTSINPRTHGENELSIYDTKDMD